MRVVTRCASRAEFIAMFRRFCSARSCFIPSLETRPIGVPTAFSIRLADGTPLLRGRGVVLDSWDTAENPFKRPGVHLGIHRLTTDSIALFEELLAPSELKQPATPAVELPRRAPPANPLLEMTDDLLDAFLECQLNEEYDAVPGDALDAATIPTPMSAEATKLPEPIARSLGVAEHVPAAPSLVATELVDRIEHVASAGVTRKWWVAGTVMAVVITIGMAKMAWSNAAPAPIESALAPSSLIVPPAPRAKPIQMTVSTCKPTVAATPANPAVRVDEVAPVTGSCTARTVDVERRRYRAGETQLSVIGDPAIEISLLRKRN
jgi:hypothetical protein